MLAGHTHTPHAKAAPSPAAKLRRFVIEEAKAAGFDLVAITSADAIPQAKDRLRQYIADGHHATMEWMEETEERRGSPKALWPDVRSVIVLAMNYGPDSDPTAIHAKQDRAAISVYAQNRDYHDIIKGKLKGVASRFVSRAEGHDVKVFVDTAPVMEKPLAEAAGIGWQGKQTNLVSRTHGSWLFLGSIFTTADLEPDRPERDHCGSCRACLDSCPTDAFPAPYRLDARRCISYLTIEHKGHIAVEYREAMGNRIFGCDDCLAVCPWNKFATMARETKLAARQESDNPPLTDLLKLDDDAFRGRFRGTPIKRTGRDRFMRNVLIAAGNSGDESLLPQIEEHLSDASPLVRAMAVWALSRLAPDWAAAVRESEAQAETDPSVADEWARIGA